MSRLTERLGKHGEFKVCSYLSLFSDTVTIVPHGSQSDLIAEFDDVILSFQVKTLRLRRKRYNKKDGSFVGRSGWQVDLRRSGNTVDRNYSGSVDIFAVYIKPMDKLLFFLPGKTQKIGISDRMAAEAVSEQMLLNCVQHCLNIRKKNK